MQIAILYVITENLTKKSGNEIISNDAPSKKTCTRRKMKNMKHLYVIIFIQIYYVIHFSSDYSIDKPKIFIILENNIHYLSNKVHLF